jgi:hypothetical protein
MRLARCITSSFAVSKSEIYSMAISILNALFSAWGIYIRVNDHPYSGWLGFYRHRREKTGARSAPVVAGETGCEAPGLKNPINVRCVRMDGRDRGCENLLISGHFQPRAVNPTDKKGLCVASSECQAKPFLIFQ